MHCEHIISSSAHCTEQWSWAHSFLVANMVTIRAALWFSRLKDLTDQIYPRSISKKMEELHQESWPTVLLSLKPLLENMSYLHSEVWATKQ